MPPYISISLISLSAILALIILSIPIVTYRLTFRRRNGEPDPRLMLEGSSMKPYKEVCLDLIEKLDKIPCENVTIKSFDGLTLHGRYYHKKDGAPLEIQCHGYKSTPMRDFAGGALETLEEERNLLLIYQRSHGKSEGKSITFGYKESRDLIDWTNYFLERLGPDTPVLYMGISMGGATVLMASGSKDLPGAVKAVIADCPYSDTRKIILSVLKGMKLPAHLLYPFLRLGARIFAGFDPNKCSPMKMAARAKIPILLIHGEEDRFVPTEMTEEILKVSPTAVRKTFPGARHGLSYLSDSEEYMKTVKEFLRNTGICPPEEQDRKD